MTYEVFADPDLYKPPILRAAYSDRTSLMMAELALLAYEPYETPEGREDLRVRLEEAGFSLKKIYNVQDTQAFMVTRDVMRGGEKRPGMVIVSFRGTETGSLQDIRTDLKAGTMDLDDVPVHRGFYEAVSHVRDQITADLQPLLDKGYALYLTGHSLGGALALFATQQIGSDSTGSCYTFGAPRVAGFGFGRNIKTPVYRVVNSYDAVPVLPPEILPAAFYKVLSFFGVSPECRVMRKLNNVHGYVHHGDMRYLTHGRHEDEGRFDDVELYANPSLYYRFRWWLRGMRESLKGSVRNHSIELYCQKLRAYARKRN